MAIRMLLLLFVLSGALVHAGPCLSGPLSGYLGGSCTLSGVVFDNCSYAPGATGVLATSINVTPSVAGPVFEFLEMGPGWLQAAGGATSGSMGSVVQAAMLERDCIWGLVGQLARRVACRW